MPFYGSLIIIEKLSNFKTLQSLSFLQPTHPKKLCKGQYFWLAMTSAVMCHKVDYFRKKKSGSQIYGTSERPRGPLWVFVSTIPNVCWPKTLSSKVASGTHTFGTPCIRMQNNICKKWLSKRVLRHRDQFEVTRNTVLGSWTAHNFSYGNPLVTRRFGDPLKRVEQVTYMVRERGLL